MEKVRLNLTVPGDLNDQVREMAKQYGMTVSGLISMIVKQYFDQQAMLKRSEQVPEWLRQIAEIQKTK